MCAAHIGVRGAQVAAGVDGGEGTFTFARRGIGLRAGQRGLSILYRNLVVARVELGDRIARLHELVLVHVHFEHLTADARAHLDQVAVHLRVVGVLAVGGAPPDDQGR